jgi:hypothetical protein
MPEQYDPANERFDAGECGQALREAVERLAKDSGEPLESFQGRSLSEIARLADETYEKLPDFWVVWKSWHAPQPPPEMGDL